LPGVRGSLLEWGRGAGGGQWGEWGVQHELKCGGEENRAGGHLCCVVVSVDGRGDLRALEPGLTRLGLCLVPQMAEVGVEDWCGSVMRVGVWEGP
jgi:hypothetical protein